IETGRQITIDAHSCLRYNDSDTILIRLKPHPYEKIPVVGIFQEGAEVFELYTGQKSKVKDGVILFPEYENDIAVISISR
ncbi:MAG: hypothetical protein K2G69_03975, partial [Muribaculaceae bacterium]|nr:hypothetical protein [Muribaculaceae bacterium]